MVERREVEAALEARRELGPEYEPEIVEAMIERIEKRLDERLRERERRLPARPEHRGAVTPLVLGSIALGIPVTAVATSNAHGVGGILLAIVAWIAIAVANVAVIVARR
jgi:hypothetical protein